MISIQQGWTKNIEDIPTFDFDKFTFDKNATKFYKQGLLVAKLERINDVSFYTIIDLKVSTDFIEADLEFFKEVLQEFKEVLQEIIDDL